MPLWTTLWLGCPREHNRGHANDLLRNVSLGDFVVCGRHRAHAHTPLDGAARHTPGPHGTARRSQGTSLCSHCTGYRRPRHVLPGVQGRSPPGLAHPHREACLQCEQRRYAVKGPAPHAALRPPRDVFAVHVLLASFTASFYTDRNRPPHTEVAFRTPRKALQTCPVPGRPLSVVSLHVGLPPVDAEVVSGWGSS